MSYFLKNGKSRFRRATLSCDSSYFASNEFLFYWQGIIQESYAVLRQILLDNQINMAYMQQHTMKDRKSALERFSYDQLQDNWLHV